MVNESSSQGRVDIHVLLRLLSFRSFSYFALEGSTEFHSHQHNDSLLPCVPAIPVKRNSILMLSISYVSALFKTSSRSISYSLFSALSFSDGLRRQSPPAKPASLSTASSVKRGTAGSMSSRHMKGAMIISIRRCVLFSNFQMVEAWIIYDSCLLERIVPVNISSF